MDGEKFYKFINILYRMTYKIALAIVALAAGYAFLMYLGDLLATNIYLK